jgi:hypothetical protein
MYLDIGSRLLDGGVPYVDIVDINPPLIWYLNTIPASVARLLHVDIIPTFLVGVWLLTVASVAATRRILKSAFDETESAHAELIAASLGILSMYLLVQLEYGQREHLFVLGFIPYLAFRFRRWERDQGAVGPALTAGLLAGIVTSLKPHFVVIALATELYWVLTRRTIRRLFRPEALAFAVAGLAYALHFLMVPEPMQSAFFGRWIPLISAGYRVWNSSLGSIAGSQLALWIPTAACALVFVVAPARQSTAWKLAQPLAVAAFMSAISVFIQHQNYSYHSIPVTAAVLAVGALVVGEAGFSVVSRDAPSTRIPRLSRTAITCVLVAFLVVVTLAAATFIIRMAHGSTTDEDGLARAAARYTSAGDAVIVADTEESAMYPMLQRLGRKQGSRFFAGMFPIAMVFDRVEGEPGRPFPYDRPSNAVEEARFRADLADDIRRVRPKVIFVQSGSRCGGCPQGFTIRDYLARTGFIGDVMAEYEDAGPVDEKFTVYVRRSE